MRTSAAKDTRVFDVGAAVCFTEGCSLLSRKFRTPLHASAKHWGFFRGAHNRAERGRGAHFCARGVQRGSMFVPRKLAPLCKHSRSAFRTPTISANPKPTGTNHFVVNSVALAHSCPQYKDNRGASWVTATVTVTQNLPCLLGFATAPRLSKPPRSGIWRRAPHTVHRHRHLCLSFRKKPQQGRSGTVLKQFGH
jgi:hypothetical protein